MQHRIQIRLYYGHETCHVQVDPENSLITQDTAKLAVGAARHAVADARSLKFFPEELCQRVGAYLERVSVIVDGEKIPEPSCDDKRDELELGDPAGLLSIIRTYSNTESDGQLLARIGRDPLRSIGKERVREPVLENFLKELMRIQDLRINARK